MREGRKQEAFERYSKVAPSAGHEVMLACAQGKVLPADDQRVTLAFDQSMGIRDPEQKYWNGARLAACGHPEFGVRLLRAAVEQSYCAPDFMRKDPMLESARMLEGYAAALQSANECQQNFLSFRSSHTGSQ
jgi:hypothetical protein